MKKITTILAVVILVIVVIGGLFFYKQFQLKNLGEITYGWNTWPGVLPYLVAYDQGFFKEEGLDIKMIEEKSYADMLNDLIDDKIDFSGDLTLMDIVEKVGKGAELKVVLVTDYSNGADGIVAKKEIQNISELKGKKVAVEKGTLGEYLLYDALEKNDLNLSDILEINISAQESAQAFIRGEVDAAVTYEPDYSKAVEQGNGWRIYTSADSPGLIIDVLAFKNDFINHNPKKVVAVIKAYFKAMNFIEVNSDQAYEIGAKYFKILPNEFKEQYLGLKQVNFEDNLNMMSYRNSNDSLHFQIKDTYDFLKGKNIIQQEIDSTKIIDPQFIRTIKINYN